MAPFVEVCGGHKACPFCGREGGPFDPGDGLGCCTRAAAVGFWDITNVDDDPEWRWWHSDDECAKAGQ